jgi:3-oxoacyl-[acyl-carrier-protein] synthase-3
MEEEQFLFNMKTYIKAISYYLPNYNLNNAVIEKEFPEWSIDKIASKTGINNRYIAASDETAVDMAVKASEKLFLEHNIEKDEIDFLILCTQSPDYFLPTSACVIQERLGLNTSIGAFDINLGCSGFVYGLGVAKGLIATGQAKNILFITAETYSKFIHPKDKSNKTIFGDAAAATLISIDGFAEIGNFVYGTEGKGAENLIVKNGGLRNYKKQSEIIIDEYNNYISDDYLFMNGSEIFLFTLSAVPKLIRNTLVKNNITIEEVDLFIFHQANRYMLENLRKKLSIPEGNFYLYLEDCGNTVSSTIPIALYHARKDNLLLSEKKVLLAGFGVGYSWAGSVLKIE